MDKCDTCFSQGWITCFAEALGIEQDDCGLTTSYQTIIAAMLRGVWRCDTCAKSKRADGCHLGFVPCKEYQPRKEDGDE